MSTNSGEMTITGLLARARAGDRGALDQLFAACRNYALILARMQVESRFQGKLDPSDLVQQSMLEAYRAFDTFHGRTGAEWLVWLRRILQHNATDQARHFGGTDKRQINREVSLDHWAGGGSSGAFPEPEAGDRSPSECMLLQERELLVADALARLPEDYREVIVLRNLQGMQFDEVAGRMKRSRPAVQMLWMRALRKLQEVLEETLSGSKL
jgi:RNA polymerase sigma-70 factor, ECF subfamily